MSSPFTGLLRGLTWDHPRATAPVEEAAAAWARASGHSTIAWSARSVQAFGDQPSAEVVDSYDIIILDHPHIPRSAAAGHLVSLTGRGKDDYLQQLSSETVGPSYASYSYLGSQWALPIDAAAQVAAFRPDLLPEPPAAWSDVFDLALTGRVLWPAVGFASFITVASSLGFTVAAPGSERFIAVDDGLSVLEHLHRLAERVPPWCQSANPIDVCEVLSSDDRFCYAPLLFGYVNYSHQSFRRHRLRFVGPPAFECRPARSCLGGAGIAVSARSAQVEEAVEFAFWLASADCQKGLYARAGGQPANAKAWEDRYEDSRAWAFYSATRETLEYSVVRPRLTEWMDVQLTGGKAIRRAVNGSLSDRAAIGAINESFERSVGCE